MGTDQGLTSACPLSIILDVMSTVLPRFTCGSPNVPAYGDRVFTEKWLKLGDSTNPQGWCPEGARSRRTCWCGRACEDPAGSCPQAGRDAALQTQPCSMHDLGLLARIKSCCLIPQACGVLSWESARIDLADIPSCSTVFLWSDTVWGLSPTFPVLSRFQ